MFYSRAEQNEIVWFPAFGDGNVNENGSELMPFTVTSIANSFQATRPPNWQILSTPRHSRSSHLCCSSCSALVQMLPEESVMRTSG